jgi:hypothetical protein
MPTTRFIRTTHENGQFRSFPPEAHQFWREQGVIVGEILRPECALTFAELAAACQEYAREHATAEVPLPLDKTYIAWVLVRLLEYGMAETVPVKPDQHKHPH